MATDFENNLANWPKIANNDTQGLRGLSNFLQQVEIAKTHLLSLQIFQYPSKIQTLVNKLPSWFLTKWSSKVQTLQQEKGCDTFPTFAEFVAEVTFHADHMNIPQIYQNLLKVPGPTSSGRPIPNDPSFRKKPLSSTTMASKTGGESKPSQPDSKQESPELKLSIPEFSSANQLCPFHQTRTHTLNECNKFRELTFDERKDFFKKKKLCFRCMSVKHSAENCDQAPPDCSVCHKRHLTALHIKPASRHQDKVNTAETSTSTACTQVCGEEETGRSCARIVLVNASHQSNPAKKLTTYAVLDDQSSDVFISDALLHNLGISAPEVDLQVNRIVGSNTIRTKKVTGIFIQDIETEYALIKVPFAYSREYIPASHEDIAKPKVASQWKHLSHIADKIPHRPDVEIGLLIGRNAPAAFQPINVISGNKEEPCAEQYTFGWTIIGRVCKDKEPISNAASVNRVTVEREILLHCEDISETAPLIIKNPMSSKDLTTPKQIREMMELDYTEIHHSRKIRGTNQVELMEDGRFREILTKGLHKNAEGNWEASLPFKTDTVTMPNNKGHCLRRLLSLKRRLLNDNKLKDDYLAFMKKTLDNGHASRVPVDQLTTAKGKTWFLPHFHVYHPRKPDQIHVVFDCSTVYENELLNKHLLQGPDQVNSLIGVLTRF